MAQYVTGTIAQLAGKLSLNGVALNQPELSLLSRIFQPNMFKQVGIIRKEGERGRPAIVWQVNMDQAMFIECTNIADGLTTSDDDAPAYVKAAAAA